MADIPSSMKTATVPTPKDAMEDTIRTVRDDATDEGATEVMEIRILVIPKLVDSTDHQMDTTDTVGTPTMVTRAAVTEDMAVDGAEAAVMAAMVTVVTTMNPIPASVTVVMMVAAEGTAEAAVVTMVGTEEMAVVIMPVEVAEVLAAEVEVEAITVLTTHLLHPTKMTVSRPSQPNQTSLTTQSTPTLPSTPHG